jgi:signal transduction histidine kinase
LLDAIPGPGWIKDPDGRYLFVNAIAARGMARAAEEIIGRGDEELVDNETAARRRRDDLQVLETKKPLQTIQSMGRTGIDTPMLVVRFPLSDGARTLVAGFGLRIVDRSDEGSDGVVVRRRDLLAAVAEELRTPLAPILTTLDILQHGAVRPADLDRYHTLLRRQAKHMVGLVDDLADASRLTTGKIRARMSVTNLVEILRESIAAVSSRANATKLKVVSALPEEPLAVLADAARLVRVFANLLENALWFTPAGGCITVVARRDGHAAEIVVEDDGHGMAPEVVARVFDLFGQPAAAAERSRRGGLGLGLALAKRLVELHGGDIAAQSEGPGRGSRFVVRIPLLQPEDAEPEAERESGPDRILIVDDNQDAADTLGHLLSLFNYTTRVVYDGSTAIEACVEFKPTLVLLDIQMPGMDGYSVAKRVRPLLASGAVIVALTALSDSESRKLTADAGCDFHLVKPVEVEAIRLLTQSMKRR